MKLFRRTEPHGNPWRGMVYGMTNRLPWSGRSPADIWKVWDEFGMGDAKMKSYWVEANPVKTDNPAILATSYVKKEMVLISLASWSPGPAMARLIIDWRALGLDPIRAVPRAPAFRPSSPLF